MSIGIGQLKEFQEKAFQVYGKVHELDFSNSTEVLTFLHEIHPFVYGEYVNLPLEHLLRKLKRNGYHPFAVEDQNDEARCLIGTAMKTRSEGMFLEWNELYNITNCNQLIIH